MGIQHVDFSESERTSAEIGDVKLVDEDALPVGDDAHRRFGIDDFHARRPLRELRGRALRRKRTKEKQPWRHRSTTLHDAPNDLHGRAEYGIFQLFTVT